MSKTLSRAEILAYLSEQYCGGDTMREDEVTTQMVAQSLKVGEETARVLLKKQVEDGKMEMRKIILNKHSISVFRLKEK